MLVFETLVNFPHEFFPMIDSWNSGLLNGSLSVSDFWTTLIVALDPRSLDYSIVVLVSQIAGLFSGSLSFLDCRTTQQ